MVEAALIAQIDDQAVQSAVSVQQTLVARIGQERLDLWFGAEAIWKFEQGGLVIDLENSFLLDCVKSFCWDELRCAVSETLCPTTPIRLIHSARPRLPKKQATSSLASQKVHGGPGNHDTTTEKDLVSGNLERNSSTIQPLKNGNFGFESPGHLTASPHSLGAAGDSFHRDTEPHSNQGPHLRIVQAKTLQRNESSRSSSPERLRVVNEVNLWNDYVAGPSNRLAFTAAEMILERPGTLSPLLLHGGSGVGKTHLSKAIAEQLRLRHGLRRVLVMTAEQFTIDYSESARGGGFASFRKKYRDVDGFILDDLAFCLGKNQTLSELRNTVDNLIRNQKQVVLVSDRPLNELSGLGNDLHARISGGMTCHLDPLHLDTRRELLHRTLHKYSVDAPESALDTLAKTCGGDGRAIFGIAFRLLAQQRSLGRPLTHDETITASLDLIRACQPVIRIADIEKAVCDSFRLDPKSLQDKGKAKTVSAARMLAMFLARKHTQAAYAEIGEYFGHRQHSTVISAHRKVQQWLDTNTPLQRGTTSISVRDMVQSLETSLQVG